MNHQGQTDNPSRCSALAGPCPIGDSRRNEGAPREAALISLTNEAIEHEIGTIHGVIITPEEIGSFKRYVDEQTKAPEILDKVKLAFRDDQASYERIYLVPKLMNWKLRSFYSRNFVFHRSVRELFAGSASY